ncbi:hypothetical protein BaRGS_00022340 [Batillaria attramentaria]|uniref:KICSTOR complex protein ITFG2 n=1 Tax=Batillaria attramentaria TaxID=370345 RepID=A0ABD0KGW7_9CAEN
MMWRNVSFVDHIEVDFPGNVVSQAMDLGDVDNDKVTYGPYYLPKTQTRGRGIEENELVVANIDGDLSIFKGNSTQPQKKASNLGMITCVRIGDICNLNKNLLVCLTAEGCCYIFDVKEIGKTTEELQSGEDGDNFGDGRVLSPVYTQNLPANCKAMLIADTDGDGLLEMAVTYSDRVVRTFRWQTTGESDAPFSGRLLLVDKWQLAGQIGAISMNQSPDGSPELLVSQPGRTYVTLLPHTSQRLDVTPTESDESKSPSFVFHPLGHNRVRNKEVLTVIVGGIQRGGGCTATYHALASLDGSMVLVENDNILWSLQVDHQLFVLDKLDVTGNGQEEVVCCSWDGQTYIVNHSREVVRYHFKENVAAFTTGYYSVPGKGNVPCFVYATFNNHIVIHHSISLPCVESTSLLSVMDKQEQTHDLLAKLNIDSTKKDVLRDLYHWTLYGWRPNADRH